LCASHRTTILLYGQSVRRTAEDMSRNRRSRDEARAALVEATIFVLAHTNPDEITVDAIAKQAQCAKGLIVYHFGGKATLMSAAIDRLQERRTAQWVSCFASVTSIPDAMDQGWNLLTNESAQGLCLAWSRIPAYADHMVSKTFEGFAAALGDAYADLAHRSGVEAKLVPAEAGWWLGSLILGIGTALASGGDRAQLRSAYMASWLGMLAIAEQAL